LTAEQEIFARYDRELEITPAMWNAIQTRTAAESRPVVSSSKFNWLIGLFAAPRFGLAFSAAMAVLIAAVVIGFMYLRTQPQPSTPQAIVRVINPGTLPPPPIFNIPGRPPTKAATPERGSVSATAKDCVRIKCDGKDTQRFRSE